MRTALLVTDLEGVAGVDDIDALVAVGAGYPRARTLLGEEVRAAVAGLVAAGFERVIVSDSHRSGLAQPNLRAEALPRAAVLDFRPDAYDAALFDGVSAVACLGMHAPAGSAGFAAHTVDVTSSWLLGERSLSEAEIVLGLAAGHDVPMVFVAGDDVLGARLGDVPYVVAKESLSRAAARSRPPSRVRAALTAAGRRAPVAAPTLRGDLRLRLRSCWQADVAADLGFERADAYTVHLPGGSLRAQYAAGLTITRRVGELLAPALRGVDAQATCADVRALLLRPTEHAPSPAYDAAARRALAAFLAASAGDASWQRADRALTLHMLEGLAPRTFAALGLAPILDAALAALDAVPGDFPPGIPETEAMARLDAVYVVRERGGTRALEQPALARYIAAIADRRPIYAWLLGELAAQLGSAQPLDLPSRPRRAVSRVEDLYWLTHLFLLETRYLHRPLQRAGWEPRVEELFLATPLVAAHALLDLAAEICLCLEIAGEGQSPELRELLALLAAHQQPDGRVVEPATRARPPGDEARIDAHCTAAALLAFAGTLG